MKKRIIVILVAILVVLLAAIAVLEITGSKDNDKNQGYDDVYLPTDSDIGDIYDLETDEVIGDVSGDNINNSDSSGSLTSNSSGSSNSSNSISSNSSGSVSTDSSSSDLSNSSNAGSSNSSNQVSSNSSNLDLELDSTADDDLVVDQDIFEIGGSTNQGNSSNTEDTQPTKEDLYIVKGVLLLDEKPLANADLELHSKVKTTKTNKNGEFTFVGVELGKHTLSVSKDGKKLGDMSFKLKTAKKTSVKSSWFSSSYTISFEKDAGGVELKLVLNEKKGSIKPTIANTVEMPEIDSNVNSNSNNSNSSTGNSSIDFSDVTSDNSSDSTSNNSSDSTSDNTSDSTSDNSSDSTSDNSSDNTSEDTTDDTSSVSSNTNEEAMQNFKPWR